MKIKLFLLTLLASIAQFTNGQTSSISKDNSLSVRGVAIINAIPEVVVVRIDLDTEDEKFNACQEKLMQITDLAKLVLVRHGIEKETIHINRMNVSEKRLYVQNQPEKVLFAGKASLLIEHPYSMEYTRKLLAGFQDGSISFHYTINFTLSEKQKTELRKKTIQMAIEDAKEKAQAIAVGANINLLKINSINFLETEYSGYSIDTDLVKEREIEPQVFYNVGASYQNSGAIDFNPKEIGIKKSITVEWQIQEKN